MNLHKLSWKGEIEYCCNSLVEDETLGSWSSQIFKVFGAVALPLMVGIGGNWAIVLPASQAIAQTTQDRKAEAERLLKLGFQQAAKSEYRAARENYQKALILFREVGDRNGEGATLNNIGGIYSRLGQYPKALEFYQQTLVILKEIGDRNGEKITFNNIGFLLSKQKQPELAIVFYKQSVNVYELIRQALRKLSKEQQKSYTETVADTYCDLADILF